MKPQILLALAALILLAACMAQEDTWTPTIDTANDAHLDRLRADLMACKYLAERAGEEGWQTSSRAPMFSEDGVLMNGSIFRRAYGNCMKERRHPVIG